MMNRPQDWGRHYWLVKSEYHGRTDWIYADSVEISATGDLVFSHNGFMSGYANGNWSHFAPASLLDGRNLTIQDTLCDDEQKGEQ